MDAHDLLPPNRTRLEEAFVDAFDNVLSINTDVFSTLLNPETTPLETINTLANDKGVKYWDSDATNQLKREQVKAAWPTRALSGTREAIKGAILGNGFTPRFSTIKTPYQVDVSALHNGLSPLTAKTLDVLNAQLSDAINERDVLNISIGIGVNSIESTGHVTQTEFKLIARPL
jgi:phage tail P2-like protein